MQYFCAYALPACALVRDLSANGASLGGCCNNAPVRERSGYHACCSAKQQLGTSNNELVD